MYSQLTLDELKLVIEEHQNLLDAHQSVLQSQDGQIKEIRKSSHETNRSILIMNETIGIINQNVDKNLRDSIKTITLLDEFAGKVRFLEEEAISRRAEKNYVTNQRKTILDLLKIGYQSLTFVSLLVVIGLCFCGHIQPETLIKHLFN